MDWDNDGNLDILSGCYWTQGASEGQLQMLRGNGELDFAKAEPIRNSKGETPCNFEISENAKPAFDLRNICTHQHAVDFDGDGDLDLVVGCFGSAFYFFENTADEGLPDFAKYGTKLNVDSPAGHSNPHLVDWDGDGDLDLLSGSSRGGVFISLNAGDAKTPKWDDFKQLVEGASLHEVEIDEGTPSLPGPNTRVWATDWNADGLLDLLVGDQVTLVSRKSGISAAEYEKRRTAYDQRMAELSQQQQHFVESRGDDFDYDKMTEEEQAEMAAMNVATREVYDSRSEYISSRMTGRVWLLIQKARSDSDDRVASN